MAQPYVRMPTSYLYQVILTISFDDLIGFQELRSAKGIVHLPLVVHNEAFLQEFFSSDVNDSLDHPCQFALERVKES